VAPFRFGGAGVKIFFGMHERLQQLFSLLLLLMSLISSILFLFAIIGVSVSPISLQKYSWIEAKSDGTVMGIGKIYGGTNAFYITGDDSDVLKYVDCKDLFDFCQSCGNISSSTTFLISITFLSSLISLSICAMTIFSPNNGNRRTFMAFLTFLLGLLVYVVHHKCELAYRSSNGIYHDSVTRENGVWCVLYGFIVAALVGGFSLLVKILESYGVITFRSANIYATTEIRVRSLSNEYSAQKG
jgi:hypothetical protein